MEGARAKVITAVLTAVLIFNVVSPIPSGIKQVDEIRYQTAEANEAVAIPIVGTVLLAYGFYICANNDVDYGTALETAWTDLCTFADNSGIMDARTLQGAIASAVTSSGSVYLDILNDTALPTLLSAWANDGVANGSIGNGENSISTSDGVWTLANCTISASVSVPDGFYSLLSEQHPRYATFFDGKTLIARDDFPDGTIRLSFTSSANLAASITTTTNGNGSYGNTADGVVLNFPSGYYYALMNPSDDGYTISLAVNRAVYVMVVYDGISSLNPSMVIDGGDYVAELGDGSNVLGNASQALLNGFADSAYPTGTYEAFTPTTAQLEAGYDSTALVEAIESGTEVATDISGSVSQILTQITGLSDVFGDLRTQVQTLVTDFASQLAWAGAESFPNVMNTVIDGLGDISGGIEQGVSDLLDGLADIPGADVLSPSIDAILDGINELVNPVTVDIPAVLEGVQEGVLSIPDAIEVGLADVISAVNAQTLDIVGAIESAVSPFTQSFEITENDGQPLALPNGVSEGLLASLEDKVPFCYVIRSANALNSMFANFAGNRSFYFELQLPYTDELVRFDGETLLSQNFGMFDLATTFKIVFTLLICFALLWRSYKIVERMAM